MKGRLLINRPVAPSQHVRAHVDVVDVIDALEVWHAHEAAAREQIRHLAAVRALGALALAALALFERGRRREPIRTALKGLDDDNLEDARVDGLEHRRLAPLDIERQKVGAAIGCARVAEHIRELVARHRDHLLVRMLWVAVVHRVGSGRVLAHIVIELQLALFRAYGRPLFCDITRRRHQRFIIIRIRLEQRALPFHAPFEHEGVRVRHAVKGAHLDKVAGDGL